MPALLCFVRISLWRAICAIVLMHALSTACAAEYQMELANGFIVPMASSANMADQMTRAANARAHEHHQIARAIEASRNPAGAQVHYEEDEEALLALAMEVNAKSAVLLLQSNKASVPVLRPVFPIHCRLSVQSGTSACQQQESCSQAADQLSSDNKACHSCKQLSARCQACKMHVCQSPKGAALTVSPACRSHASRQSLTMCCGRP